MVDYKANAFGHPDKLIQHHPVYSALGATELQCQLAYRELFSQHLNYAEICDIREALNQELVLGRDDFKDKIELIVKRQTRLGKPGRPGIEEEKEIYYVM